MKYLVAAALLLTCVNPALSAPGSDATKNAGAWTMAGASEGQGACTLKFTAKEAIGGWALDVPAACVKAFTRMQEAAAWTLYDGGKAIGLINPLRQRIYRFEKTADGDYVTAPNKDGEQFVLSKGPPPKELSPQERMSGGWSLTALGGKPRCGFTSTSNQAVTQGALAMKPQCAAKWKSAGWASWTQKAGKLKLLDAQGKVLQTFNKGDAVTWEAQTGSSEILYFSRD